MAKSKFTATSSTHQYSSIFINIHQYSSIFINIHHTSRIQVIPGVVGILAIRSNRSVASSSHCRSSGAEVGPRHSTPRHWWHHGQGVGQSHFG